MKQTLWLILASGLLTMTGCNQTQPQPDNTAALSQTPQRLQHAVTLELDYLLYLPKNYQTSEQDWPLMVFLHGVGERGTDINKVKRHGPPQLIGQGHDFPFIVVSPQCPPKSWWPYETPKVLALIDQIAETYRVDENRIYLTGLSMGGFGTWAIAGSHPDRFAAIAPVCGGAINFPFIAPNMKNLPVWAFHGDADTVVPVERSKEVVEAINKAGGKARLTTYPGVGHNSWTQTYANEELYQWLLSKSKQTD